MKRLVLFAAMVSMALVAPTTAMARPTSMTTVVGGAASHRVVTVKHRGPVRAHVANTSTAICFSGYDQPCGVDFTMTRGYAVATALDSNGQTSSKGTWCFRSGCSRSFTAYPYNTTVIAIDVTGPNVNIYWFWP